MNTVFDLERDLQDFVRREERVVVQAMKGMATSLRNNLADKTPVLTGRASGSWNANLNTPNITYKPKNYENPTGARRDGEVNIEAARIGDEIHVSNSIEYIRVLNDGDFYGVPRSFVELAEMKLELDLSEILAEAQIKARG